MKQSDQGRSSLPLWQIAQGDALAVLRTWPTASVHCAVTSPPYFGLRDYGEAGQGGLEGSPAEHIAWLVGGVLAELARVLRPDGTLWLNYGDCYATQGGARAYGSSDNGTGRGDAPGGLRSAPAGLKPKDLVGMPWRVAFAAQAAGWWLRSDIIWSKPNPMPESVTDRPTRAHEYVFLLTRAARYFYDAEAVREDAINAGRIVSYDGTQKNTGHENGRYPGAKGARDILVAPGRNLRTVWTIPTQPYPGAHYATFPERLVEPCIKAGTSERGCCPACGAPWVRVVEVEHRSSAYGDSERPDVPGSNDQKAGSSIFAERKLKSTRTLDWRPSCGCDAGDPVPCVVADPFAGSGTVGIVAARLGRAFCGIDLAGGDKDLGGHTAHQRIAAARDGRPLDEWQGHQAAGQLDLLDAADPTATTTPDS